MKGFIQKVKIYSISGFVITGVVFGMYAYMSHIFMMPMFS